MRSLKHPFNNGKLPVRGRIRMSMMMVASAAMTNIRRIWRSQQDKPAASHAQKWALASPLARDPVPLLEAMPGPLSGQRVGFFSGVKQES